MSVEWQVRRIGHRSPYTAYCKVKDCGWTRVLKEKQKAVDASYNHSVKVHGAKEDDE